MLKNPLNTIILTSYNRPKMVKESIESALSQTYENFELIILDDNSNQETLDAIAEYKDPRIIFRNSHIKEKDRYKEVPYARQINVGLKMAKGELISYLTDDDLYLAERLEKMVNFLESHQHVRVCYGRQKIEVIGDRSKFYSLPNDEVRQIDKILTHPGQKIDHCSVMHYKSCVDKVGNWDTKLDTEVGLERMRMADAYYWEKLAKKYMFYPVLEVVSIHRYNLNSISEKVFREEI